MRRNMIRRHWIERLIAEMCGDVSAFDFSDEMWCTNDSCFLVCLNKCTVWRQGRNDNGI